MAVKLHRCPHMWTKITGTRACGSQKALDERGSSTRSSRAWPRKSKRTAVIEDTGQSALPAIELDDGTWYREQSAEMAAAIRAGAFGPAA